MRLELNPPFLYRGRIGSGLRKMEEEDHKRRWAIDEEEGVDAVKSSFGNCFRMSRKDWLWTMQDEGGGSQEMTDYR